MGHSVLLFDYRGYGGNPGRPIAKTVSPPTRAPRRRGWRTTRRREDRVLRRIPRRRSRCRPGGRDSRPRRLILRSPFTSLPDVAAVHYPWLPVRRLLLDRYPSIDRIASVHVPVLVIAGDRDDIVPERLSRRLYDAANEPKRYVLVPGAGHNDREFARRPPDARRDRKGSCRRQVSPSNTGGVKPAICEQFGIDFPLFAFSHCRDVVAAVTNAGGFGVLGATAFTPELLDQELSWIDDHVGGKSYGVDLIVPAKFEGKGEKLSSADLAGADPGGLPRVRRRAARRARHRTRGEARTRRVVPVRQHRQGPARRGDEPPDQADRQRAGRAAGLHDRRGQGARRSRRRARRRQGARRQAGRRGGGPDRRAGHRGGRPLRRGDDAGADPRSDRGDRRRRSRCWPPAASSPAADGGVGRDGRRRGVDRVRCG